MEFKDLITTRKGFIGEEFVKNYLEQELNYQIWWNSNNKSQPFDAFAFSGTSVKNLIEVKVKTLTSFGTYSIHENDLIVYERYQKEEKKKMLIFYLDYNSGRLNVTTTRMIRDSIQHKTYDEKEHKTLIYFDGYSFRKQLPEKIIEQLKNIK